MSAPPPGWYPDPESTSHLRYWDGEVWAGETVLARQGRVRVDETPDGEPTAAPWFRLLAEIIDAATLVPVILLLGWPFLRRISSANWNDLASRVGDAATVSGTGASTSTWGSVLGILLVGVVVAAGYRVVMWQWKQATLGQLALDLRLRPWETEETVGLRQSVVRSLAQFGFLPLFAVPVVGWAALLWPIVDSLWVFRDERGQTLHDRLAGTCIVGGPEEEEPHEEEPGGRWDFFERFEGSDGTDREL